MERNLEEIQKLKAENFNILKVELTGKKITLKSNVYYDRKMREYLVKEVTEATISTPRRIIHGVRLVNDDFDESEQPFLKYPTEKIQKEREGGKNKLTLIYSYDVNIDRDFRHLHKATRPDLEIYIYY